MSSSRVYVGIGSNRGDREGNLLAACRALASLFTDFEVSPVYETKPQIVVDQPSFLNMAASGLYPKAPHALLKDLQSIEASLGRNRSKEISKGPRTMDLDILLFDRISLESADLIIPHPEIEKRAFVLTPLLDIIPPGTPLYSGYKRVLDHLEDQGVEYYNELTGFAAHGGKGIE